MSNKSLDRVKQSTLSGFVRNGDTKRRKMNDMTAAGSGTAGPALVNMLKVNGGYFQDIQTCYVKWLTCVVGHW